MKYETAQLWPRLFPLPFRICLLLLAIAMAMAMADDQQPVLLEVLHLKAHHLHDLIPCSTRIRAIARLDGPLREPYESDDSSQDILNPAWETPFTVALRYGSLDSRLRVSVFFAKRNSRSFQFVGSSFFPLRAFAGPHGAERNGILESTASSGVEAQPRPTLTIRAFLIGRSGSCYAARAGAKLGQPSRPVVAAADGSTSEPCTILYTRLNNEDDDSDSHGKVASPNHSSLKPAA